MFFNQRNVAAPEVTVSGCKVEFTIITQRCLESGFSTDISSACCHY